MTAVERFDKLMADNYSDMRKKYKQFCFLHKLTFDEDVLQETYLKVRSLIERKGLKDESDKGMENYFFLAFKKNTFLAYNSKLKSKLVLDADIKERKIVEEETVSDRIEMERFDDFVRNYILSLIQLHFDSLSTRCWRLKRLISINGKRFTYEQIRKITNILDCKKRIVLIDRWIKQNIKLKDIYNEYSSIN